jgi:hypothetical protein
MSTLPRFGSGKRRDVAESWSGQRLPWLRGG